MPHRENNNNYIKDMRPLACGPRKKRAEEATFGLAPVGRTALSEKLVDMGGKKSLLSAITPSRSLEVEELTRKISRQWGDYGKHGLGVGEKESIHTGVERGKGGSRQTGRSTRGGVIGTFRRTQEEKLLAEVVAGCRKRRRGRPM